MAKDLFTFYADQEQLRNAPLADRLRPKTLEEFLGQRGILAEGRLLYRAIKADRVGNLLLHGPPGVGKTTLARIIAANTRAHFSVINAVLAGVKEIRIEVAEAKERMAKYGLRTILFIDEVHRFNTAQQDALLPWVENGTLSLIGATTENPYFEVNNALVSRARIFRFQPLDDKDLHLLLERALKDSERGFGNFDVHLSPKAASHLVDVANGDARCLLNALELAVQTTIPDNQGSIQIDLSIAEESIQERAVLYDKQGDVHYDTISAFIKALRGSDPDAALFWLARMVEAGENPKFLFRRMLIAASEDIGLADPQAIVVIEACAATFDRVGMPEGLYALAQAALYLASAEKSNSLLGFFEAQKIVRRAQKQDVPSHLRDANRDRHAFGDGANYRYPHAFAEHWVNQQYLPRELQGEVFWKPSNNGWEGERREKMMERRTAQLATLVELSEEQPFLSYGPEIPEVERWIQRQLLQEEERLQRLSKWLWDGVNWNRQDRVLILGGRSLLWSLNPLCAVPEGGVTILSPTEEDQARLFSQLELLDLLLRPVLINESCNELRSLASQLNFEWVGGRIFSNDLTRTDLDEFWSLISEKCSSEAKIRLLITHAVTGPAQSIEAILDSEFEDTDANLFNQILMIEKQWLKTHRKEINLAKILEKYNWQIEWDEWEENLFLPVDNGLEERWLGENRPYQILLKENAPFGANKYLKKMLANLRGKKLPQKLIHQRLSARRK